MDIHEILEYLPHRYPFLLIDRVVDIIPGERLLAIKNVTYNEPFFQGHFPGRPVMPGVLILEAMAQATGLLALKTDTWQRKENSIYYFVGIDKARFRKPVEPGDQLMLDAVLNRVVRGIGKFTCTAKVGDDVVASGELMCAQREIE